MLTSFRPQNLPSVGVSHFARQQAKKKKALSTESPAKRAAVKKQGNPLPPLSKRIQHFLRTLFHPIASLLEQLSPAKPKPKPTETPDKACNDPDSSNDHSVIDDDDSSDTKLQAHCCDNPNCGADSDDGDETVEIITRVQKNQTEHEKKQVSYIDQVNTVTEVLKNNPGSPALQKYWLHELSSLKSPGFAAQSGPSPLSSPGILG